MAVLLFAIHSDIALMLMLAWLISDEEADDYEPYYHVLKETLCGIEYEVVLIINVSAN